MYTTENHIRLAAIKLISRNGFEAMSLRQLAAHAQVTTSTLYLYFQNKDELLLALVMEYLEGLSLQWQRRRPAAARADVQLLTFIAGHVRFHLEHQDQAILGNLEFRSLHAEAQVKVRHAQRLYLNSLQAVLEQGVKEGCLRCAEPKLMARTLSNLLTHACIWYQDDGRWCIDEVISHYSALVLKMLGAAPSAFQGRPAARTISRRHPPNAMLKPLVQVS
ncbi:TetR/AcrR family transcriptional regulator [Pseudomonas tussilaginis]|uniref:TetR/AcrR family transcriptional regulator n=1 Tax=Pseudomonas sp. 5 TaxID=1619949 RepID=UPI0005EB2FF2|nr:TetR/AcrR family transcriptional regulator [Pseudomonas sp. 5]KJK06940.1 transcriptional regulator [Pseudomonas sp. 5]